MATLLAHWKLNDDAANTTVVDSGPNSNDGTASDNTSTLSVAGKINDALELDYTNDEYVELMTGTEALNIIGDESSGILTIAFWFKADSEYGDDDARIISRRAADYWAVRYEYDNENLWVYNTGDTLVDYYNITYNTWIHIFLELDYDSGTANLWVDNAQDDTGANVASNDNLIDAAGTEQSVCLGVNVSGGPNVGAKRFNGAIDDVRLYSGSLTQDERDLIYNSGSGTEDGLDTARIKGTSDALATLSGTLSFETFGIKGTASALTTWSGYLDATFGIKGTASASATGSGYLIDKNLIKPSIIATSKRLVAIGNDIIYYEDL